jgi:hypothetical protein
MPIRAEGVADNYPKPKFRNTVVIQLPSVIYAGNDQH